MKQPGEQVTPKRAIIGNIIRMGKKAQNREREYRFFGLGKLKRGGGI